MTDDAIQNLPMVIQNKTQIHHNSLQCPNYLILASNVPFLTPLPFAHTPPWNIPSHALISGSHLHDLLSYYLQVFLFECHLLSKLFLNHLI